MILSIEPTNRTGMNLHVIPATAGGEPSIEGAQCVHDAVRVDMRRSAFARPVLLVQDPYAIVLEITLYRSGFDVPGQGSFRPHKSLVARVSSRDTTR